MYSLFGILDLDNFLNMEKLLVSLCDLFAGKLFTTLDTKLEYTKEMMVVGQNAFNLTYIFQMGWNHQLEKSTSRKQKALTSAPVWCHVSQWRERPLGLEGWSNDERDKLSCLDLVVSVRLEIIPKLYINGHRELHNMSFSSGGWFEKKWWNFESRTTRDCNEHKAKLSYFSHGKNKES